MSSSKQCAHKNGKAVARCEYTGGSTEKDCETKCNAYHWCIAYSYNFRCQLMTSTGCCDTGLEIKDSNNIATSTAQLQEGTKAGSCMLKAKTGINL